MFIAPRASFTRPADVTQYGAGDLVANSTTAALVVPMRFGVEQLTGRGKVVAATLFTDNEAVTAAIFNLNIFRLNPGVPANGDNGAFAVASARDLLAVVACDMSTGATATTTDKVERFPLTVPLVFELQDTNRSLYALLSTGAGGTYTPLSGELFEVTLEIEG